MVLEVTKAKQVFHFTKVAEEPTPSILRNFSAPVELEFKYSDQQLAHLLAHDSDAFNRWEAGQRLAMRRLLRLTSAVQAKQPLELDTMFIEALRTTLNDTSLDPAFREQVLTLPSSTNVAEHMAVIDPHAIRAARHFMRSEITRHLKSDLLTTYESNLSKGKYIPDAISSGKRALKNLALAYLQEWPKISTFELAHSQFNDAKNMTDRIAALACMLNAEILHRDRGASKKDSKDARAWAAKALKHFYSDFKGEALVVDKWFTLQGSASSTDVATMRKLLKHPAFNLHNPNRARSLIYAFCNANPAQFHAPDGSGYALWSDLVLELNAINPQVAARLARSLDRWRKYTPALQEKMQAALQKIAAAKNVSRDVLEIVSKALAE
jgi:aminopeptidase N